MENKDMVNHPKHYTECSIECIEAMEIAFGYEATFNFCKLNAFKYLWRHKTKNGEEDIKKAFWYVDRAKKYEFWEYDDQILSIEKILTEHESEKI